jgi:hypothetical protein
MSTQVYLPAFYLGVQEELEKAARFLEKESVDLNSMPMNENILPNLSGQAKWRYVRTKDGLKLSDGNLVYGFGGLPEDYPSEDARVSRSEGDNILDFEKDSIGKGTAQIHRSSPDNIYMTLADGRQNPTFMLQHEEGKNWRYSPSKKFVAKLKAMQERVKPEMGDLTESAEIESPTTVLDTSSLTEGANDHLKQAFEMDADSASESLKALLHGAGNMGEKFISSHAAMPVTSLVGGYAASKGVSKILDHIHPERVTERAMDPSKRTSHEIWSVAPSALATLGSMAIKAQ